MSKTIHVTFDDDDIERLKSYMNQEEESKNAPVIRKLVLQRLKELGY